MASKQDSSSSLVTELVSPRSLRPKDKFLIREPRIGIFEVVSTVDSKPGKHGSAKTVAVCQDIITGKNNVMTLKDSDIKMWKLTKEPAYFYKAITKTFANEGKLLLASDETIDIAAVFPQHRQFVMDALMEAESNPKSNSDDLMLCVKYIKMDEPENTLFFSGFVFLPVEDVDNNPSYTTSIYEKSDMGNNE